MNARLSERALREKQAEYTVATARQSHPLVAELWALKGQSDLEQVQRIAGRSGLPLRWLTRIPQANGERGWQKLMEERNVLLLRNRRSAFIDQFEHPLGRCAKFFKLVAYNSCNYWCEYCYLYQTFRNVPVSTHFVNYEDMFEEIKAFDRSQIPDRLRVLNLGELGDPLAVDDITEFSPEIIPFMPRHTLRTKLLFLTKSDNVNRLLNLDHGGLTILSFSINTDKVWRHLEHRAPSPSRRLEAARNVQASGYEVRLRIDPVMRYSTWRTDYAKLVEQIFEYVNPSRITIGEYRPAHGLGRHIADRFPNSPLLNVNGGLVADAGKLRYPEKHRLEMFDLIVRCIRDRGPQVRIALCKEPADVWRKVGLELNGLCCNCLS